MTPLDSVIFFKYLTNNEEIAYLNSLIYLQFIAYKLECMWLCVLCACTHVLTCECRFVYGGPRLVSRVF